MTIIFNSQNYFLSQDAAKNRFLGILLVFWCSRNLAKALICLFNKNSRETANANSPGSDYDRFIFDHNYIFFYLFYRLTVLVYIIASKQNLNSVLFIFYFFGYVSDVTV